MLLKGKLFFIFLDSTISAKQQRVALSDYPKLLIVHY